MLGLGKLGARELSYASDMDVMFVCDGGGLCPRLDGGAGERMQGDVFWTKVAQDLTRLSRLSPTISAAQYESTATSIGIAQDITQFQQDFDALGQALNSSR